MISGTSHERYRYVSSLIMRGAEGAKVAFMFSKVPPQGIRVLSVARRDAAVASEEIRTLRSFVSILGGLGGLLTSKKWMSILVSYIDFIL